jgi:hypothetical protein
MMVFGTFEVSANPRPETEISSEVDIRTSVTSKPLGG